MTATERHRYGEPAPSVRTLSRPEWAAYWPPRALSVEDRRQMELDLEMLEWADSQITSTYDEAGKETYEAVLSDALDRADLHGWRRHLLLAIQGRLG